MNAKPIKRYIDKFVWKEEDKIFNFRLINVRQRGFIKGKDTLKHVQEIIDKVANTARMNGE